VGPVQPPSGSRAGYYPITLDLTDLAIAADTVESVNVGGVKAYDLTPLENGHLQITVQGAPQSGDAAIELTTGDTTHTMEHPFHYNPPLSPHFERVVALGASLTQGVQRGTPSKAGAIMSPPAQLARQIGAYHPLPLLHEGLFPQIGVQDLGEPPTCELPSIVTFVIQSFTTVMAQLTDPDTGETGYQYGRIDPDITVHNLAVGGSKLSATLHGPTDDDLGYGFLGHLVYEPYGPFLGDMEDSQATVLETLDPTLIISTDLYGNDIIWGIVANDNIDPSFSTPVDELKEDLRLFVDRMAATGAQVFLADLPKPSMLPVTQKKQAIMERDGVTDVVARIETIDAMAVEINAALALEAARFDNVHLVPIASHVATLEVEGLPVGDQLLHTKPFGGLLGLDGVHFTNTGYALVANAFIMTINETLDTDVPLIDLAAVMATDPESPKAIQAAGFDPALCD